MPARSRQLHFPKTWCIFLLALALCACTTTPSTKAIEQKGEAPARERSEGESPKTRSLPSVTRALPTAHVWANLTRYSGEEEGFATYTYVLVGRDRSHKATWARYVKLVDAIRSSTTEDSLAKTMDRSLLNLFLIPVRDEGQDTTVPNDKLSMELLTALSTALPGRFHNPGPYLITLNKPIRYGHPGEIADIFFVDLSRMNNKSIEEVIRDYKKTIIQSELMGERKLNSLRLSILNTALTAEDCYGFVKVAFAELQKAFYTTNE